MPVQTITQGQPLTLAVQSGGTSLTAATLQLSSGGASVYGPTAGTLSGPLTAQWSLAGVPVGSYAAAFTLTLDGKTVLLAETVEVVAAGSGAQPSPEEQFDLDLAQSLGDGVGQPGADGAAYPAAARRAAAARAVREYSRFRPRLRRYGTADLFQPAGAGAASVLVVGGGFAPGDAVLVDAGTAQAEPRVVLSVSAGAAPTGAPVLTAGVSTVALTAALSASHPAGALLAKAAPGLVLAAGQDTYPLPADWLEPEWESFDAAVGLPGRVSRAEGFYDASYGLVARRSGQGAGDASNAGPGGAWGPWPFAGDPAYNPNGAAGAFGQGAAAGCVWRFYRSAPPRLRVTPAPTSARTLDFDYQGLHTLGSVPEGDLAAVMAYALYSARLARAAALAQMSDTKIGDVERKRAVGADKLRAIAEADLKEFNRVIRDRAFLCAG